MTVAFDLVGDAGRGSIAQVFRARGLGSADVALKVAHRGSSAGPLAAELEALILASGPHLPRARWAGWITVDGGVARGAAPDDQAARPAIAIDWVEGSALAGSGASGEAAALRLAATAGGSLALLHAAGFAHGDLSASNVLVDAAGAAHLVDLGLATSRLDVAVRGGTPRYLGRGDADLGTAEARDLLALGLLIAETCSPRLRTAEDLLLAARAAELPPRVAPICTALLAPQPHARPSAQWVVDRAGTAPEDSPERARARPQHPSTIHDSTVAHHAALVRAAYAKLRRAALRAGGTAPPGAAPWLAEILHWAAPLSSLRGDASPDEDRTVSLLSPPELVRWLVALIGPRAVAWPLGDAARLGEGALARALLELASSAPPRAWTFRGLLHALEAAQAPDAGRRAIDARIASVPPRREDALASLALALAATPPSEAAITIVEGDDAAPAPLALAAARALASHGEPGRALSLASRAVVADPVARATLAEIQRRAGDIEAAEREATAALADAAATGDAEIAGQARATLARIRLDRGDPSGALDAAEPFDVAQTCEVGALAHAALGRRGRALELVEAGIAIASSAEARCRLVGTRGYVLAAADPAAAREAFTVAVDEAARAGAVVEEATYLTGAASAAVDEGYLEQATLLGERAALLWDALGRPRSAARALLARAAAFATAGVRSEAQAAASRALEIAHDAADPRASLYARFAMIDVAAPAAAGELVSRAIGAADGIPGDARADRLRAFARALRIGALTPEETARFDDLALNLELAAASRLEWWGERAHALESERSTVRSERVIESLVALSDTPCELSARGPALAAGARLAAQLGLGDAALRLRAAARRTSEALLARSGALAEAVRALPWLDRASEDAASSTPYERDQVARLEHLVRSLASNEDLGDLMRQVLDALVAWTGVERGLFLLRMPNGALAPRAARNLARHDLRGEQLALSRSLAQRALDERSPVVAVDAAGELPDVHQSVHALRLRSVLAVPLFARGEPIGVVYLDDRVRRGAFGERELAWVRTLASLASGMVAAAMGEAHAEKHVRRSERARRVLERSLAERDARVSVLETELGKVSRSRGLRPAFDGIIGESEPFVRALAVADRVATADIPVLLMGESGSGKELFARAIHAASPRRDKPFVSENCGAIPETLLESTLFGHVRGAFTGADRTRVGLFEAADGGTLFLDEVGEMSLGMQAKLLRILEEGIVRPVGSERSRKVDVRLIAATHRDLEGMVGRREFREDLYYRMSIVSLRVPSLRERRDDVPLLVKRFLDKHAPGQPVEITKEAMRRLEDHTWPGNVRQLENEVRRALVLAEGAIDVEHLSPELGSASRTPEKELGLNIKQRVDHLEAELVKEALAQTHGNQTRAAQLLGLSRFGLQKMIKRLGIRAP